MKKYISIIIVFILLFSLFLCGCSENETDIEEGTTKCVNGDLYTYIGNQWVLTEKDCSECNNENIEPVEDEKDGNDEQDNDTEQTQDDEKEPIDSDNDGLNDSLELSIGTDPYDDNTDGDRYSDYDEYNGNTPTYVKSEGDDPLFPAYPEIEIYLSDSYDIRLSQSIETSYDTISSKDYTYTVDDTTTSTTGWSNTLTVGLGFGLTGPYVYGEDQFTYSDSTTNVLRINEQYNMGTAEQWGTTTYTDLGESYLSTNLYVENIGTDIINSDLDSIWLSLYIGDDSTSTEVWTFGHDVIGAKIGNLKPGEIRDIKVKFEDWIKQDLLKRIDNGEPIRIEIQAYDLGDDEKYLENAKRNLVRLEIDTGSEVKKTFIKEDDVLLTEILEEYADANIEGNNIVSIKGLPTTEYNSWDVILPSKNNLNSFSSTRIYSGDKIVLVYNKDSDQDKLLDRYEIIKGLDPYSDDTDHDGINDFDEINGLYGDTDPLYNDTDFDGLLDGEEIYPGDYGCKTDPTISDKDGDGLTDGEERILYNSNPCIKDTDGDDLLDYEEIYTYLTNPCVDDTDGDGLTDYEEIISYGTNPVEEDTDFDGLGDDYEITHGTSPLKGIFYAIDDTFTSQQYPDNNYYDYEYFLIRNPDGWYHDDDWELDAYVKFDLSNIPANTKIINATLSLYYYDWGHNDPSGNVLSVWLISDSWNEQTLNWNNQPSVIHETASTSVPSESGRRIEWNVSNDVQDIINGNLDNYGWKIIDENQWDGDYIPYSKFRSMQYPDELYHLYLEIEIQ